MLAVLAFAFSASLFGANDSPAPSVSPSTPSRLPGKTISLLATNSTSAKSAKTNASATKPKKQKHAPGEEIFDNKTVLPMRIEVAPSELNVLRRDDRHDVRATVWEGTNAYRDVGLHVKGAAGSHRGFDDKPALTLNFQKFTPEQRFHGLRKIHLNNSVQDPSYITENLCSELYRKAGVPTPRVTYATLELNGRKKGFYVVKEGFTKDMLGIYFKNPHGNLYDGGFLHEITDQLERDSGGDDDVKDWSDLKALAKAAQMPDINDRFDAMCKVLDMDRFATFCALQIITWDWDGYVMNRNNYRVYHDLDTGRMVFLPHGMDQMFWETSHYPIPRPNKFNGLVANKMIETPQGRKLYRQRFGEVFTNIFQIEMMTNRVDELATLILAHVGNTNEVKGQIKVVRDRIIAQHANFEKRLSEPEPKPLVFASGIASITNWTIPLTPRDPANAIRDRVQVDGRMALHIQTTNKMTNTSASWRADVLLAQGNYRLEVLAKVSGVVSLMNTNKGGGAGIRHSGIRKPRENKLEGNSSWEKLDYEFDVKAEEQEIQLLCELRATEGEVWFDEKSFRLVKVK